jgi:hypothetical protein
MALALSRVVRARFGPEAEDARWWVAETRDEATLLRLCDRVLRVGKLSDLSITSRFGLKRKERTFEFYGYLECVGIQKAVNRMLAARFGPDAATLGRWIEEIHDWHGLNALCEVVASADSLEAVARRLPSRRLLLIHDRLAGYHPRLQGEGCGTEIIAWSNSGREVLIQGAGPWRIAYGSEGRNGPEPDLANELTCGGEKEVLDAVFHWLR